MASGESLQQCLWDSAGGKLLISEKDLDDIWQGYKDLDFDSEVIHKANYKRTFRASYKAGYHERHKRPKTDLPSQFCMDTCVDAIQMVAYRSNEFLTMENMNRSIQKLFKMIKNPKVNTPRKLENLKQRIYAFSKETVWMSIAQIQEIRDGKYDDVCVSEVLTLKTVSQEIVGDKEDVMEVSVLEPIFSMENGKVDTNLKEDDVNLIGGL